MADDLRDFQEFMKQREQAARAYVSGDGGPLAALVATGGDATFFAPRGGTEQDAAHVASVYARDVNAFLPGGESHFEILHMQASDSLAYWVGIQHASARMRGQAEPVTFALRITELFRREGDAWKLIHRHADPLAKPSAPGK